MRYKKSYLGEKIDNFQAQIRRNMYLETSSKSIMLKLKRFDTHTDDNDDNAHCTAVVTTGLQLNARTLFLGFEPIDRPNDQPTDRPTDRRIRKIKNVLLQGIERNESISS
ncbi:unnamed protein product [Onchocerca ochengi]|uniref:Transposase n=1 Tax=Onchocerca ochengi TaxID=42157 RepID=A0A182ED12_ONCOC|nr:unnamed protein product [Onchocerca ochengi]